VIKITKPGRVEYKGSCEWCGCEFVYADDDIRLDSGETRPWSPEYLQIVKCPTCGRRVLHRKLSYVEMVAMPSHALDAIRRQAELMHKRENLPSDRLRTDWLILTHGYRPQTSTADYGPPASGQKPEGKR
jgi:hypothetical protein